MPSEKQFLHLDGDAFFASCELTRRRDLQGTPVVVGAERGIATAMNREAKALGIERGAPVYKIRAQYGNAVAIIPSHFDLYQHIAEQCYTVLRRYASTVERYSIDECFVDISHISANDIQKTVLAIQQELLDCLGVTYSCGIGRTKTLAKLGSKFKKPFGCTWVQQDMETKFLEQIAVADVWGIGRRLAPQMHERGITTACMLRDASEGLLLGLNTITLRHLQDELRGISRHVVKTEYAYQKSVESTRSFGEYHNERSFVVSELSRNVEIVAERLHELGVVGKEVRLFIKTSEGRIYAEAELPQYTDDVRLLLEVSVPQITQLWHTAGGKKNRYKATGICVAKCIPKDMVPQDLFGLVEVHRDMADSLQGAVRSIRGLHGHGAILYASSLESGTYRGHERDRRDTLDPYIYGLPLPYLGEVI